MPRRQVKCPVCRMWIDSQQRLAVPTHTRPGTPGSCDGSGKSPAGTKGKFD